MREGDSGKESGKADVSKVQQVDLSKVRAKVQMHLGNPARLNPNLITELKQLDQETAPHIWIELTDTKKDALRRRAEEAVAAADTAVAEVRGRGRSEKEGANIMPAPLPPAEKPSGDHRRAQGSPGRTMGSPGGP